MTKHKSLRACRCLRVEIAPGFENKGKDDLSSLLPYKLSGEAIPCGDHPVIILHSFFNSTQNTATINCSAGQLIVKLRSSSADEMYGELVHLVLRETLEDHCDLAASDPCDTHAHTHREGESLRTERQSAHARAERERMRERETRDGVSE